MAITMNIEGLAELSEQLAQLGEKAQGVAALGLYEGAGIMAEEIKRGADTIRTEEFHYAVFPAVTQRLPTPEEKAIVQEAGAGIAKFRKNGSEVDTSVGYRNAGYAELKGKSVPIPKIVNAINSGTSFMKKQSFVRKAASSGAQKAEAAITKMIEQKFNEIIK
jgi:hypothetical protein